MSHLPEHDEADLRLIAVDLGDDGVVSREHPAGNGYGGAWCPMGAWMGRSGPQRFPVSECPQSARIEVCDFCSVAQQVGDAWGGADRGPGRGVVVEHHEQVSAEEGSDDDAGECGEDAVADPDGAGWEVGLVASAAEVGIGPDFGLRVGVDAGPAG